MDKEKLRELYWILKTYEKYEGLSIDKHTKYIKKKIREYNNKNKDTDRVIIKSNYDGYVEKILFDDTPDMVTLEEMEEFFEDNLRKEYVPSLFDCTGQAFTTYHKICVQNGHYVIYHRVCFDV